MRDDYQIRQDEQVRGKSGGDSSDNEGQERRLTRKLEGLCGEHGDLNDRC